MSFEKVNIDFENCYGIKKLKHTFSFESGPSIALYAPNGMMKTSLAKVFKDLAQEKKSKDERYPDRTTKSIITDENGTKIRSNEVLVIAPFDKTYESKKTSRLLVNPDLKAQYLSIVENLNELKDQFIKPIAALYGKPRGSKEVEVAIQRDLARTKTTIFKALKRVEVDVEDLEHSLGSIRYTDIFNPKVEKALSDPSVKSFLLEYNTRFDELIDRSLYFRRGIFNHNHALDVAKSLKKSNYFKAKHTIRLNDDQKGSVIDIEDDATLEKLVETEKARILNDEVLLKSFNELDTTLTGNAEVKKFRQLINENQGIIGELDDLPALKEKLWMSYFKENYDLYKELIKEFDRSRLEIEKIELAAENERDTWEAVVNEFMERFSVPFKMIVENKQEAVLGKALPSITVFFKDENDEARVKASEMYDTLSMGEQRAAYLLNVIFEIRSLQLENEATLLVIDDIADSFDYKNKYAIIEYLIDIAKEGNFRQLILTHNFDFLRTVKARMRIDRSQCLMANRANNKIQLKNAKYVESPLNTIRREINGDDLSLISAIPIARNIIEYTKGSFDQDYALLTKCLHIKEGTSEISLFEIQEALSRVFPNESYDRVTDDNENYLTRLFEIATEYSEQGGNKSMNLKNKLLLSIAIRMKAEQHAIVTINDQERVNAITSNQERELMKIIVGDFPEEFALIELLKKVNLMTPENLHVNSFMYEPILDMSDNHLKDLYKELLAYT